VAIAAGVRKVAPHRGHWKGLPAGVAVGKRRGVEHVGQRTVVVAAIALSTGSVRLDCDALPLGLFYNDECQ
jgi:hypothetical protein